MAIEFCLNGELQSIEGISPSVTVLDYLRDHLGLTGTKEGCAEGDCGACSVVLTVDDGEGHRDLAVNACLLTMPQLNGAKLTTVEGLAAGDLDLDPVQQTMADGDGTQCGFCTPGFIMSLYALRRSGEDVSDVVIHDALAGNLCRCTGYRPIVDAARAACAIIDKPQPQLTSPGLVDAYAADGVEIRAPKSITSLAEIYASHPDAYLLAGGTDLGLLASKERQALPFVIHTAHVAELRNITDEDGFLEIGAAVTYTDALPYIERHFPSFATLIRRIGSRQIRNVGTIGGNIGNASPIGDTPPCLIALNATINLFSAQGERSLPIEEFFLDYRKTDLTAGEFIKSIRIPLLSEEQDFRTYKISKRHDQDISSVISAFRIGRKDNAVTDCRIAFGGMAATPKRAPRCEAALSGAEWVEASLSDTAQHIGDDYSPIDDHRASRNYRLMVAGNLFVRLYRDLAGVDEILEVVSV